MASSALKFALNVAVCYILAYGIAKPAVGFVLTMLPESILTPLNDFLHIFFSSDKAATENLAMLVGMCLFVVFNYFGQRFFAFKNEE